MHVVSVHRYVFMPFLKADSLSFHFSADPLVGSIATQYVNDRKEHDKIAKEWTKRYAT